MQVNMEPKPVLAVCMNGAWQKTLLFKSLALGDVNRAAECHEGGGGKGVNVARVLRRMGFPVSVATFAGGDTGAKLVHEFEVSGIHGIVVPTRGVTRCCYTVVDEARGEATELIEPSAPVEKGELGSMLSRLTEEVPKHGMVALCGSLPPGVTVDFYRQVAEMGREAGVPVVLDAFKDVECVLEVGVSLLKINRSELGMLCGEASDVLCSGRQLLERFPRLVWLVVTAGGERAMLMGRGRCWRVEMPHLESIVSPIGGGDCATGILARRLAEDPCPSAESMGRYVVEALACASASCLTSSPSVFDNAVAQGLMAEMDCVELV